MIITGFSTFPGVDANPTGLLVDMWRKNRPKWASEDTVFEVLPVEYRQAESRVIELVSEASDAVILMLGVSGAQGSIQLERFALNVDDAEIPDVSGEVRQGRRIISKGSIGLETSFDLWRAREYLIARDLDVCVSNHAGSYVCNHCYYTALHTAQRLQAGVRPVFVHVPLVPRATTTDVLIYGYMAELNSKIGILASWFRSQ